MSEPRIPLWSVEAEMSAIGSMILAQRAAEELIGLLDESDFYRPAHRMFFSALRHLLATKQEIDVVTLRTVLIERKQLADVGGVDYLLQLAEYVPSAANAKYYAQIVSDKASMRKLEQAARDILDVVHDSELEGADDRLQKAGEILDLARRRKNQDSIVSLADHIKALSKEVDHVLETGEVFNGCSTGFATIDEIILGLFPGDYIIVGARPSMGKTAFATQLAINVAKAGTPVLIFSAEMSSKALTKRIVSSASGNSPSIYRDPSKLEKQYEQITKAMDEANSLPIYVDESTEINLDNMAFKCKEIQRMHGGVQCLFIVDYLQHIVRVKKGETKNDATERTSRALQQIAKNLNSTFVALAQLSRGIEKREDKRPALDDLRDSGGIEQDADIVAFLFRPEYYESKKENRPEFFESSAEFIVRKQRNGPLATAHLAFRPSQTKFMPLK